MSNEEYILALEELYLRYGDNAFQHLGDLEKQTFYNEESIRRDLKRVRERIIKEALEEYALKRRSLKKDVAKSSNDAKESQSEATDSSCDQYFQQLRQLYLDFGNDAFQRMDEIQEQTGYPKDVIKRDLRKIRKEDYVNELEKLYAAYGKSAKKHLKPLEKKMGYQHMTVVEDLKKVIAKKESCNLNTGIIDIGNEKGNVDRKGVYNNVNKVTYKPKTIDSTTIFKEVKNMPIKFEYYTDINGNYNEIVNVCSAFLSDSNVLSAVSNDVIMNLERNIQKKRERNPIKVKHDNAMELNILFAMYRYSYLMNTIVALEKHKNDIIKVDFQEYWSLIHDDCMKRLDNLEQEKRNNPVINTVLDKYKNTNGTVKMKLLSEISHRENDYIISTLMVNVISVIMHLIFNGITMDVGGSSSPQEVLKILTKYPSKDVCMLLDTHIVNLVVMRNTTYVSGGGLRGLR